MNEKFLPLFEKNNIKCNLSEYYIKIVKDMINQLLCSTPWKRLWEKNFNTRNNYTYDYSSTIRSTYPDWSKFAFERSIYTKKIPVNIDNNIVITKSWNILLERKYWLSWKQFIEILEKSLTKSLTQRQWNILEEAFFYFFLYIKDYEILYNEKYFWYDDL